MSTTWTNPQTNYYLATCTSGSESAPTVVTEGMALTQANYRGKVGSLSIHAEAAATMTAGGLLKCYLWNPFSAQWNECPDLTITVTALKDESYAGIEVPGAFYGTRVAYVPSGVGQAVNIFHFAVRARL